MFCSTAQVSISISSSFCGCSETKDNNVPHSLLRGSSSIVHVTSLLSEVRPVTFTVSVVFFVSTTMLSTEYKASCVSKHNSFEADQKKL